MIDLPQTATTVNEEAKTATGYRVAFHITRSSCCPDPTSSDSVQEEAAI